MLKSKVSKRHARSARSLEAKAEKQATEQESGVDDVNATRNDLQNLMTKAQGYCRATGVASGDATLASKAPRRRGFIVKRPKRNVPILRSTPNLQMGSSFGSGMRVM